MEKNDVKDFGSFLKENSYWDNTEAFYPEEELTEDKEQEETAEIQSDIKPFDPSIDDINEEPSTEPIAEVPASEEVVVEEPKGEISAEVITEPEIIEEPIADEPTEVEAGPKGCKVVFLNGVISAEHPCDHISDILKEKLGDSEEIKLFQLNIQPVNDGPEPKDGMVQVYNALEGADAIIVTSDLKKGALSSVLQLAMERLSNHFKNKELRNLIFGSVICGQEDSYQNVKANLLNYATNLGMLVGADSQVFCCVEEGQSLDSSQHDTETSTSNAAVSIKELCSATSSIRGNAMVPHTPESAPSLPIVSDIIKDFDQFTAEPEHIDDMPPMDKAPEVKDELIAVEEEPVAVVEEPMDTPAEEEEEKYDYINDIVINKLETPMSKPNPVVIKNTSEKKEVKEEDENVCECGGKGCPKCNSKKAEPAEKVAPSVKPITKKHKDLKKDAPAVEETDEEKVEAKDPIQKAPKSKKYTDSKIKGVVPGSKAKNKMAPKTPADQPEVPATHPAIGKIKKIKEDKTVHTFSSFLKVNETGEWNNHIDWNYVKNNPDADDEYSSWIKAMETMLEDVKEMLPDGAFEIHDIKGFDMYQGPYAHVSIGGKKYKIWTVNSDGLDMLWIENFPVDNTSEQGNNPGFEGTVDEVADVINAHLGQI